MTDSPDPRDLFDKADALLGRYRGESRPQPDFPTLTEVVEVPPAPPRSHAPPEPRPAPAARIDEGQLEAVRRLLVEKLQPDLEALLASALAAERPRLEEQLRLAANALLEQAETDVRARLGATLERAIRESVERIRASL